MKTLHSNVPASARSGGSPVVNRAECVDAQQRPATAPVRLFASQIRALCDLTSDLAARSVLAGLSGVEYVAIAEGHDSATHVTTGWMGKGMWNRTPKFGPFDHFQRWRFAT